MAAVLPPRDAMGNTYIRYSIAELMALGAGRALAFGLHPVVAWRVRPRSRARLVVGYFVASYALVLGALMLLR